MKTPIAIGFLSACVAAGVTFLVCSHFHGKDAAAPQLRPEPLGSPDPPADSEMQAVQMSVAECVAAANALCEARQKDLARPLYLWAAEAGSADAHFALAYRYVCSRDERLAHYTEAARQGHADALARALDLLVFRAESLTRSDPQAAVELYHTAKEANPSLTLFREDQIVQILTMCNEVEGFDPDAFIAKYNITEDELTQRYGIWQLAEEASRGGRFGEPDPELVLNLVIRGSFVPGEFFYALPEVYDNWKRGVVEEFKICHYITSRIGAGFCASRFKERDDAERAARLQDLQASVVADHGPALLAAFEAMNAFIDLKTDDEEPHGGSWRAIWEWESNTEQKDAYLDLLENIRDGFAPTPADSLAVADRQLNETYQAVMATLRSKDDHLFGHYLPTPERLRAVQRLWIVYRDASVECFARLNPSAPRDQWAAWLTEIRTQQLTDVTSLLAPS